MIHLINEDFVAPLYDSIIRNSPWHFDLLLYCLVYFSVFKISHELEMKHQTFSYVFGSISSIFVISNIFFFMIINIA